MKKCRQEPGLQPASKVSGIFVGRVPSRGVFESFHSSKGTEVVYRSRRIHREGYAFCPSQEGIFSELSKLFRNAGGIVPALSSGQRSEPQGYYCIKSLIERGAPAPR